MGACCNTQVPKVQENNDIVLLEPEEPLVECSSRPIKEADNSDEDDKLFYTIITQLKSNKEIVNVIS